MPRVIGVCESAACTQSGSAHNIVAIEDILSCVFENKNDEINKPGILIMKRNCLGHCDNSPNIVYRNPPNKPKIYSKLDNFDKIVNTIQNILSDNLISSQEISNQADQTQLINQNNTSSSSSSSLTQDCQIINGWKFPPSHILKVCEFHWITKKLIYEEEYIEALEVINNALRILIDSSTIYNSDDLNTINDMDNDMWTFLYLKLHSSLLLSKSMIYLLLNDGPCALSNTEEIIHMWNKHADNNNNSGGDDNGSGDVSGGGKEIENKHINIDNGSGDAPIMAYMLRADAILLIHSKSYETPHNELNSDKFEMPTTYFTSTSVSEAYQIVLEKATLLKQNDKIPKNEKLSYADMKRVKNTIENFNYGASSN